MGTIEGAYFVKTGQRIRLSQQQLVDCSWGEGNNGCDGGEDFRYRVVSLKSRKNKIAVSLHVRAFQRTKNSTEWKIVGYIQDGYSILCKCCTCVVLY